MAHVIGFAGAEASYLADRAALVPFVWIDMGALIEGRYEFVAIVGRALGEVVAAGKFQPDLLEHGLASMGHEDRAVEPRQHEPCGTAKNEFSEPAVTIGSHHDEASAAIVG